MSERDREGETSEEEIARVAGDLVRFWGNLPASAKRAYAELAAIDRELGEKVEPSPRASKKDDLQ